MARKILKQEGNNVLYHHTGVSKFTGCQCIKDCTCNEDFNPKPYDYYTVKRTGKKTTTHFNIEEAEKRFVFVNTLL